MLSKVLMMLAVSLLATPGARAEEVEELNPFAPGVEETLRAFDAAYEADTGYSAYPAGRGEDVSASGCYQRSCAIFVDIDKGSQTLRLYLDGRLSAQWLVSTGRSGFATPSLNKRFSGRIYRRYDSSRYPGGDYRGLGNMPYAMFIAGGIALHGTPEANWRLLGRPASHGCIRILPENAAYLNQLLRAQGVRNSWVTVH